MVRVKRHLAVSMLILISLMIGFQLSVVFHSKSEIPPPAKAAKKEENSSPDKRIKTEENLNPEKDKKIYIEKLVRESKSRCKPIYGRVEILVIALNSSYSRFYKVAQSSLKCFMKTGIDYKLRIIDPERDQKVQKECSRHKQFFFLKHCAVSVYLREADWVLVQDGDTGVVNPKHCIEEWIDERVDIIFYERFFNWEIASGNYLVKNTYFAQQFLKDWANYEFKQPRGFSGADNGAVQIHILRTVIPDGVHDIEKCDQKWQKATGYETYMEYVMCCKVALGARRTWLGKLKIHRRGQGWVRDWFHTLDKFCDFDFMFHGWKQNTVGEGGWQSPFKVDFDLSKCDSNYNGWNWREGYNLSEPEVRLALSNSERNSANGFPANAKSLLFLLQNDTALCWPKCPD